MTEGFVYVADSEPGLMAGAAVGTRVRAPSLGPPWIVVDHAIETVIVARWPGRLLRVASVPPGDGQERAALARAAQGLRAGASYTRVLAVDVLAELPPAILFGRHGEAVAGVLERAGRMTAQDARELAAARHPGADQAYSRAWQRWLGLPPQGSPGQDDDYRRVLEVYRAGRARSPVGHALQLTWACVTDSARRCAGPAAFGVDADGEEVLLDPWATAASALLDAAMAFGAPDLLDPQDARLLASAWRAADRAGD